MSIWSKVKAALGFEKRLKLNDPVLIEWFGDRSTSAGMPVTEDGAMNLVAVYACVRIISETIASLPLMLYRRTAEKQKERADDHVLWPVLYRKPNPLMTSFRAWEVLTAHCVLRGNAYAEIVRDRAGRVRELWPLPTPLVRPEVKNMTTLVNGSPRKTQEITYRVLGIDGEVVLRADQVLHLRGLSSDGFLGYSPISLAREALGLALATQEFGARFFGQGAAPGGVLEHPGQLTPDAAKRIKADWKELREGSKNSHRLAVLEEGMKWTKTGVDPDDAQFLDTRMFQLGEIARMFRVPLHLLQDLQNASYATVEQQGLDFATHCIRPWLERFEQEIEAQVLTEEDVDDGLYVEWKLDALVRGDLATRYNSYATGRQWGWLSINDVRNLENMDPVAGGDTYLEPMNMQRVKEEEPAESSPDAVLVEGSAAPAAVQDTALNGAQVSSLLEIVAGVAAGTLPGSSAIEMILISFPTVSRDEASAMIAPAEQMAADKPEQPAQLVPDQQQEDDQEDSDEDDTMPMMDEAAPKNPPIPGMTPDM